jgi:hypothetical protein
MHRVNDLHRVLVERLRRAIMNLLEALDERSRTQALPFSTGMIRRSGEPGGEAVTDDRRPTSADHAGSPRAARLVEGRRLLR